MLCAVCCVQQACEILKSELLVHMVGAGRDYSGPVGREWFMSKVEVPQYPDDPTLSPPPGRIPKHVPTGNSGPSCHLDSPEFKPSLSSETTIRRPCYLLINRTILPWLHRTPTRSALSLSSLLFFGIIKFEGRTNVPYRHVTRPRSLPPPVPGLPRIATMATLAPKQESLKIFEKLKSKPANKVCALPRRPFPPRVSLDMHTVWTSSTDTGPVCYC